MEREDWALVASIIVMLFMCSSYFFKKKSLYLVMQGAGIVVMMVTYLLRREYFAMVGLGIGLMRSVIYLLYEYKDKNTPIFWPFLFSALGIACYFIINLHIQGDAKPLDIIYLVGLVAYAFVFWVRNLKLVRYLVLIPTALSLVYNACIGTAFVALSYGFELCANTVTIVKYRLAERKKSGENNYEQN